MCLQAPEEPARRDHLKPAIFHRKGLGGRTGCRALKVIDGEDAARAISDRKPGVKYEAGVLRG